MVDVYSVLFKFVFLEILFLMKKYIGIYNRVWMFVFKYFKVLLLIMVIGKFDKKYVFRVIRGIMLNLLRFKLFLINLILE